MTSPEVKWRQQIGEGNRALAQARLQGGQYTLLAAQAFSQAASYARAAGEPEGLIKVGNGYFGLSDLQSGGKYTQYAAKAYSEAARLARKAYSETDDVLFGSKARYGRIILEAGDGFRRLSLFLQDGGKYTQDAAKAYSAALTIARELAHCHLMCTVGVAFARLARQQSGGRYTHNADQAFAQAQALGHSNHDWQCHVRAGMGYLELAESQRGGTYSHKADRAFDLAYRIARKNQDITGIMEVVRGYTYLAEMQDGGKYSAKAAACEAEAKRIIEKRRAS